MGEPTGLLNFKKYLATDAAVADLTRRLSLVLLGDLAQTVELNDGRFEGTP